VFKDRKEAGERLAEELARYKDFDMVLLAIPRGGVPVAYESRARGLILTPPTHTRTNGGRRADEG
jgi:predicted phosphoribosyltransferase